MTSFAPHIFAEAQQSDSEPYPPQQRLMQGWSGFPVARGKTLLRWDARDLAVGAARLRLAVAVDVREIVRVELAAAKSGRILGVLDLRFSYVFQLHEIRFSAQDMVMVAEEGLSLRCVEGENPLWLLWRAPDQRLNALCPHFLPEQFQTDKHAAALDRLASLESLQPFGWLEGCVLDGLLAWQRLEPGDGRFRHALENHLKCFEGEGGSLIYENPRNAPADGTIYGEEGPLPLAIVALTDPASSWLEIADTFFNEWGKQS